MILGWVILSICLRPSALLLLRPSNIPGRGGVQRNS